MATKEFIHRVIEDIKDNQSKLNFNTQIFEIMEGNLLQHVEASLRNQFANADTVKAAIERAAPINIWNKIVKKLSKIYVKGVVRETKNPGDQELIDYYVKKGIDKHLGNMNENYNSYKWSTIEIYEDPELLEIAFRSIPSNQFVAYSNDPINNLRPTAITKLMGTHKMPDGSMRNKYWIYTKDEFIPVWDNEEIVKEDLDGNEGVNPFNTIPFEYISMSDYLLVPMPDKDTLKMTILIPILITDQNYGSMMLSFPIIYVTDADTDNLPTGPNTFLNIKSMDLEKQASVGVVKASPDLAAQMKHALEQLNVWLESRDISAASMGNLNASTFPSGISRAISELDTSENRKMQELAFSEMESSFWKRLAKIHNTLAAVGRISNRQQFSNPDELEVTTTFASEMIIESRAEKIARLKLEVDAGLTSKRRAIAEANPKMNEEDIMELMAEIEEERGSIIEVDQEEEISNGLQTV